MKIEGEPKEFRYEDYLAGTREILEQSKKEKEPYYTSVGGKQFIVYPNVFSPKYFNDTELFAKNLPAKESEEMLEIGPGTGAISIVAAERGAKRVVAIDINLDAVRNSEANVALHNVQDRMEVRHGDLYGGLKEGEKFDSIFWNTPFGLVEDESVPDLEKAVYDPGYRSTERFIKEATKHLKENGRVLIGFSTTLGRFDLILSKSLQTVRFEIFEAKPITNPT